MLTKNFRIPQGIADHLCYAILRNSGGFFHQLFFYSVVGTYVFDFKIRFFQGRDKGQIRYAVACCSPPESSLGYLL